jgi:hypothetical protein
MIARNRTDGIDGGHTLVLVRVVVKNNKLVFVSITNTSSLKFSSMINALLSFCDVLTTSALCSNIQYYKKDSETKLVHVINYIYIKDLGNIQILKTFLAREEQVRVNVFYFKGNHGKDDNE